MSHCSALLFYLFFFWSLLIAIAIFLLRTGWILSAVSVSSASHLWCFDFQIENFLDSYSFLLEPVSVFQTFFCFFFFSFFILFSFCFVFRCLLFLRLPLHILFFSFFCVFLFSLSCSFSLAICFSYCYGLFFCNTGVLFYFFFICNHIFLRNIFIVKLMNFVPKSSNISFKTFIFLLRAWTVYRSFPMSSLFSASSFSSIQSFVSSKSMNFMSFFFLQGFKSAWKSSNFFCISSTSSMLSDTSVIVACCPFVRFFQYFPSLWA